MNPLNDSIIKTLAWYDLFDCPLTIRELNQFLDCATEMTSLQTALDTLVVEKKIIIEDGFYSLRSDLKSIRLRRFATARHKLKKSRLVAYAFSSLPWIRFIGLANQIGVHNLRLQGDLDFFIITKPGRLWLTRLFTAGAMALLRQRPSDKRNQDTICLSFFVTSDALDLKHYQLPDTTDFYFIHWLANLTPLYDADDYYRRLINANPWLKQSLPNWTPPEPLWLITKPLKFFWPIFFSLSGLEKIAQNWQVKRLPVSVKTAPRPNVIYNNEVIKLHIDDRRRQFIEKYFDCLAVLKSNILK